IEVMTVLAAAQRYGVTPGDVRRTAAWWLSGEEVGDIFIDGQTYDVNVWSIPEARHSVDSVRELLIPTHSGGNVRLGDVARVRIVPAADHVDREKDSRKLDVLANVRGRDLGSVARDVDERLKQVKMPVGYHAEVLGEWAELQAAQSRLNWLAIAAGVGTLLCLQGGFRDWGVGGPPLLAPPPAPGGGLLGGGRPGGVEVAC